MICKNCHTVYEDSNNYCPNCGAKHIRNRLNPSVLLAQVNEQFLSIDNKLLQTFICLFTKPEDVIVSYIEGTRKKYFDVLQYFAFALTIAGVQVLLMSTFFSEALDVNLYEGLEDLPGQENNPFKNMNFSFFTEYQGLFYILGVPISAFATWSVYHVLQERRYNFTEHMVINLYYSAQIIIVTALLSILMLCLGSNYLAVSTFLTLPSLIYLYYILKRIFKEAHIHTFAKFMAVTVVYLIGYFGLGIIVALVAAFFTIFNT